MQLHLTFDHDKEKDNQDIKLVLKHDTLSLYKRSPASNTFEYTLCYPTPFFHTSDLILIPLILIIWSTPIYQSLFQNSRMNFLDFSIIFPRFLMTLTLFIANTLFKSCQVLSESILIVKSIGVQISTTYINGRTESRFIDRSKIMHLVINEGIRFFQIKYYLALIVKDENRMIIIFEHFLPRLPILRAVYLDAQSLL